MAVGLLKPLANCDSVKLVGKVAASIATGDAMLSPNKNHTAASKCKCAGFLETPKPNHDLMVRKRRCRETKDFIAIPPTKGSGQ